MGPKIVINDKEVKNPIFRVLISIGAILFSVLVAGLTVFLVLPLVGVVFSTTIGIVIIVLVALVIGLPILILVGWIIGLFLKPFGGKGIVEKKNKG
jgi:ABC-type transport system involved in cytochrome c biogenesis permease component